MRLKLWALMLVVAVAAVLLGLDRRWEGSRRIAAAHRARAEVAGSEATAFRAIAFETMRSAEDAEALATRIERDWVPRSHGARLASEARPGPAANRTRIGPARLAAARRALVEDQERGRAEAAQRRW